MNINNNNEAARVTMPRFKRATRRELATAPRFTEEQEARIRALLAYGPLTFEPAIDPALAALGWIEEYCPQSVDLREVATRPGLGGATVLFDSSGTMHPWLKASAF